MDFSREISLFGEQDALLARPSSRHDFRVAIICALSLEAEMVELVFDRHWSNEGIALGKAAGDYNIYSLGLVGKHNVVLAFMPRIGSNSAVAVASGLRSSFPNLEIALLVGVCGASPVHPETGEEIILGDCIIGTDVVQYDFGRQYPSQFRRKNTASDDSGNARPEVRFLIERLKTVRNRRHMAARLAQHLITLQTQEPQLDIHYPGLDRDRLFQADYLHTHYDSEECISCIDEVGVCTKDCNSLECKDQFLVARKRLSIRNERDHSSMHPDIHFGRFGSANIVMRSGIDRDQLVKQEKIAAFEMEGSGVCGLLPTIIIKAACDYADSHKGKEWQKYAAAVSASALKAVLETIELPDRESLLPEAMSISMPRSWFEARPLYTDAKGSITSGSSGQQILRLQFPSLLDSSETSPQEHYTNTESWLFDHTAYKHWKSSPGTILWIYGTPWCGKTVLCSSVLREARGISICGRRYATFFSFQAKSERQSACHLLQSVLLQLYQLSPTNHCATTGVLTNYLQSGALPSLQLLSQLIIQTLTLLDHIYLVVDAIDECLDRRQLLDILLTLASSCDLSVFVTSRQQFAAEVLARGSVLPESMLAMTADVINLDLKEYVYHNLQDKTRFGRWSIRPLMLQEIENLVVEKSRGCFKLAASHLEEIETCLDSRMVKASLSSIPRSLANEYDTMFRGIRDQYIPHARRLFQLLLYWPNPIKLIEAVDFLAVDANRTPAFNPEFRMPDPLDISMVCGNLLAISTIAKPAIHDSVYIHLVHPSVRQFLSSGAAPANLQPYLEATRAQTELRMVSAAYLSSVINMAAGSIHRRKAFSIGEKTISKDFPFLKTALWITWQCGLFSSRKRRTSLVGSLQNRTSDLTRMMYNLAVEQTSNKHITSALYESRKLLYCAQDSVWDTLVEAREIVVQIRDKALREAAFSLGILLCSVDLMAVEAYCEDVRGKRWTILPVPTEVKDCLNLASRAITSKNILIPRRLRGKLSLEDLYEWDPAWYPGLDTPIDFRTLLECQIWMIGNLLI